MAEHSQHPFFSLRRARAFAQRNFTVGGIVESYRVHPVKSALKHIAAVGMIAAGCDVYSVYQSTGDILTGRGVSEVSASLIDDAAIVAIAARNHIAKAFNAAGGFIAGRLSVQVRNTLAAGTIRTMTAGLSGAGMLMNPSLALATPQPISSLSAPLRTTHTALKPYPAFITSAPVV